MIKTILAKNKIGFSVVSNSISKNNSLISPKNTRNEKSNDRFYISTTNSCSSSTKLLKNSNIYKANIQQKRNFYTAPQFQNKKYDIIQSIPNPQNLKDIYRILNDISMSSYFKTANIRISFFNQERDKCDIKGVKLYGSSESVGWIVIVGSYDSSQWNNVALSLYLSSLFAEKPLKNFDVIIFPVENPTPISADSTANRNALLMSNTLNQIQQSGTGSSYSPTFFGDIAPQQFINMDYSSSNDYYPKTKGNHALNEWLKKSRKDFNFLNINRNNSIEVNHNKSMGFFDSGINQFDFNNRSLVLDESNEDCSNQSDLPNFMLEIKNFNISPNLSAEELYALGSNLASQIMDIDNMYIPKKISPMGF
ncbi:hypothetical protein DICPUDRAFT_98205 [Dictyostelium purpureum]|uniref:Uncharacterized protein n=1 Tax=Dictyostelium purpureum TaxID=5786 RepID=F0ZNI3_DICPU|nr:uncharacterized protein DICPUDRAFT_98205 [Dictyostelium purpureum]EGC34491.1 hypothetical protein DICPUDRAFT_98205 [Dictyostelium purpureum]|eukprot:XP_003288980.1 hypothetical protein DICPUDRAFT_98205 [Dictyostelium purpureum]